jgi:hypothetical protein
MGRGMVVGSCGDGREAEGGLAELPNDGLEEGSFEEAVGREIEGAALPGRCMLDPPGIGRDIPPAPGFGRDP